MITLDSPIVGAPQGTIEQALASVEPPGTPERDYISELWRLCALVQFDAALLFSQAHHETAGFTSRWWREHLNPAGIGVTGDPAQDAASPTFKSGTDAARAQVVHMWAYSTLVLPPVNPLVAYIPLDPRYEAVFDAGLDGSVRVLGDLGNGRWATDPTYAQQIADKCNAIFADSGSQNTGGHMTVTRSSGCRGRGSTCPCRLPIRSST